MFSASSFRSIVASYLFLSARTPPDRFNDSNVSLARLLFFSARAFSLARFFASTAATLASFASWISAVDSWFTASTTQSSRAFASTRSLVA